MSKQTHGGSSSGYDLDIDLSNPHLEINPSIEIKDDFLVMVESAGELLLQQAEELSDTFTHTLEIIEQTDDSAASLSSLGLSTAQLTQQADELSEANARLANYETEIARLSEILSEMRTQLRNKNEIINWIVRSRSWRITSVLRRLNFLRLKMLPGLRRAEQIALRGQLEKPKVDGAVSKFVQIEGWVYSIKSPVKKVEAFLDTISLGTLRYGQPRLDVTTYPSKAPINCGYEGTVLIDASFAGHRTLTIRVTDQQGRVKDFNRTIRVIQAEDEAGAEKSGTSSGKAFRSLPGGQQKTELSVPASVQDDLSAAK